MELSTINTYTKFPEPGQEPRINCLFTTVGLDALEPSDVVKGVTAINPDGTIITGTLDNGHPNFTPSDYFDALETARQTGVLSMDSPVIPPAIGNATAYFNIKNAILPYVEKLNAGTLLYSNSTLETLSLDRAASVNYNALMGCRNLTELYAPNLHLDSSNYSINYNNGLYASKLVLGSMSSYEWRGNCLHSGDTLIRAFRDIDLQSITLTNVDYDAFASVAHISTIDISENFNVNFNYSLRLNNCADLQTVILPNFSGSVYLQSLPKLTELNIPKADTRYTTFRECKTLQSLTIGGSILAKSALEYLSNLTYLSASNLVGDSNSSNFSQPFNSIPVNATIHLPNIKYVTNNCFRKNFNFTDETLANFLTNVKYLEFSNHNLLRDAFNFTTPGSEVFELPNCEYWYPETSANFNAYIPGIRVISLPKCLSINYMRSYRYIEEVFLPVCSRITQSQFENCSSLKKVTIPACESIPNNAFKNCSSLSILDLPVCRNISTSAFTSCTSLMTLILRSTAVCSLSNSNAFTGTPMRASTATGFFGSIYVPASLISNYKAAANWSVFSDRFGTIEDLENEEIE